MILDSVDICHVLCKQKENSYSGFDILSIHVKRIYRIVKIGGVQVNAREFREIIKRYNYIIGRNKLTAYFIV